MRQKKQKKHVKPVAATPPPVVGMTMLGHLWRSWGTIAEFTYTVM
jgi:hypothetical protein